MKKALIVFCLSALAFFGFKAPKPLPADDFCTQLNTMLSAAREGFEPVKGEATTRMITGSEKKFYVGKVKFTEDHPCYISDVSSYPECECILATDTRITDQLTSTFESYEKQIRDCLGDEWIITEQDSSNNFYLKGTRFKKLVASENVAGKRVKFHLYMYSNMIEKERVVELKFEGIGK